MAERLARRDHRPRRRSVVPAVVPNRAKLSSPQSIQYRLSKPSSTRQSSLGRSHSPEVAGSNPAPYRFDPLRTDRSSPQRPRGSEESPRASDCPEIPRNPRGALPWPRRGIRGGVLRLARPFPVRWRKAQPAPAFRAKKQRANWSIGSKPPMAMSSASRIRMLTPQPRSAALATDRRNRAGGPV
jgi:hypothetical protein